MNHTPPRRSRLGSVAALALACTLFLGLAGSGPALAGSGPVGPPILGLNWSTVPAAPCDGDDVRLLFTVCECQVDLLGAERDSIGPIVVRLRIQPDIVCVTCHPDTHSIELGQLRAGMHSFTVRVDIDYVSPPDSAWPKSPVFDRVEFPVARECGPPTGVPYLEQVVIGEGAPCATCPARVCPGDSVDVVLRGTFPDDCTTLASVTLVPNPALSPLPLPPIVRLTYGIHTCLGRPCSLIPVPWRAHIRLPEQPYMGGQVLPLSVEAYERDLCSPDSTGTFLGRANFPFFVAEACSTGPPGPCYNVSWRPEGQTGRCDATYDYNRPAILKFRVGSTSPIGGVEGTLALDTHMLVIDAVEAARPNWVVQWSLNPDGSARFIAFAATGGSAIPGQPDGSPQDLLEVRVIQGPFRALLPDHARLFARDLLVSGSTGEAIRACPVITLIDPPPTVALLCRGGRCDANADGLSDVRDLVVMVNCLFPPPNVRLACPDVSVVDCTADGRFDLDDVFCCARSMLGLPGPDPLPGDTLRAAPDIAVRFGLPRAGADGTLEVPLVLAGMDGVAAARLDVRYPDARYEVVGVDFSGAPSSWWTLHEVGSGRIALAILDLAGLDATPGPQPLEATTPVEALLRLRLRAGAVAGGELILAGHDFAAGDGVTLSTPNAEGSVELGATGLVALSAPRPNPFTASTMFALTLPVAGAVDVAIYNAAGRRVATVLHASNAAAGVYTLGWNGLDEGGGRAVGGVYFLRVVTGTGDTSRKLLFLPGGARL